MPEERLMTYKGKCRECGNVMRFVVKGDACMYCGRVGTLRDVKDIKKKGRRNGNLESNGREFGEAVECRDERYCKEQADGRYNIQE